MKIVHGSLFSGLDAPSLAASWLGWENAFHCEINPFCNKILDYWFPKSKHYEDITKTDFTKWRGKVTVLTGGFPCQPFSVAGKRKGAEDNRYLWPEMLRAIREIGPAWVIGENVSGILSMVQPGTEVEMAGKASLFGEDNRKRVLLRQQYVVETICKDLESEGYSVQPILIPACAVGAPHRRNRVWFVARSNNHRQGHGSDKQECITECNGTSYNSNDGEERFITHSSSERFPLFNATQCDGEKEWEDENRLIKQHTDNDRCSLPAERWEDFPTVPPVCSRYDGIPFDVDSLTISFPKWRSESIKAYGNSIVPQVIYEIFKAVEEIEINECK